MQPAGQGLGVLFTAVSSALILNKQRSKDDQWAGQHQMRAAHVAGSVQTRDCSQDSPAPLRGQDRCCIALPPQCQGCAQAQFTGECMRLRGFPDAG